MPGKSSLQFFSRFMLMAVVCLCLAVSGLHFHVEHRKSTDQFKANEKLCFSENQFRMLDWEKEGKEFYYNGYLYDVVSQQSSGNNIFLCVYRDREESSLHAFWNRMSGKSTAAGDLSLYFGLMCLPGLVPVFSLPAPAFATSQEVFLLYKRNYLQQEYTGLLSPPPEV